MSTIPPPDAPEAPSSRSFEALIAQENQAIATFGNRTNKPARVHIATPGNTAEPWVAFTDADRVGLALSGGGVRSATFNLGLLQALSARGMLKRFHYLATVSGGGYVGGFWTRWRKAHPQPPHDNKSPSFPRPEGPATAEPLDAGPKEIREPREIRHLREFSRFLIPRSGMNSEFWAAVAALFGGVLSSLIVAAAVIIATMVLWAAGAFILLAEMAPRQASLVGLLAGVALALLLLLREELYLETVEQAKDAVLRYKVWYLAAGAVALIVSGSAHVWLPGPRFAAGSIAFPFGLGLPDEAAILFRPSLALLAASVATAVIQLLLARTRSLRRPSDDRGDPKPWMIAEVAWGRVLGQLLAITAGWSGLAAIWYAAGKLMLLSKDEWLTGKLGAGTAGTTLLFYLLRNWLRKPKEQTHGSDLLDKLTPLLAKLLGCRTFLIAGLANLVVILALLLAAVALRQHLAPAPLCRLGYAMGGGLALFGLILLVYDPAAVGLHEFYRSRLTRCFLGGARVATPQPGEGQPPFPDARAVVERAEDDMPLAGDSGAPIHLVCCAANQTTAEDQLATLHRGARSTVLSRFGIAWGDHWAEDRMLRLSSAMTASAAAFNSLMGERTLVLGHAVPFVMTALNLRLGLWVRNPAWDANHRPLCAIFPGGHFLRELLGVARCTADNQHNAYIHLSDGGHFENLALYELIRRHCRYLVVADAGQDAAFTFDDFGRAVRRVREDFGVEIEIDLAPLKPDADGRSQQHLAVGVIHYDGVVGTDKGTLIYFKPTLTGNEPLDILQYRCHHPAFPHEPTGDQFFDEAQFESYRRLGEHIINAGLGPLELQARDPAQLPDETVFWWLRALWRKVPWMDCADGLALWERALALEQEIEEKFAPEAGRSYLGQEDFFNDAPSLKNALFAIRVCKFLEHAWVVCKLDIHWSDPRASNWMCILQRLAALPAVQDWWPAIRPLLGADFQAFAARQLHLPPHARATGSPNRCMPDIDPAKTIYLAERRLAEIRHAHDQRAPAGKGATPVQFDLLLQLPMAATKAAPRQIQIGLARVEEFADHVEWSLEDLFLVPEFSLGDYLSHLLDQLIEFYRENGFALLKVNLRQRYSEQLRQRLMRSHASRHAQSDLIDFYRSRGFIYDDETWADGRCTGMRLDLLQPHEPTAPDPDQALTERDCRLRLRKHCG